MKWSWKIGKIAGISLYVHTTFWLLLGWIAVSQFLEKRSWTHAMGGVLFVLALFSVVVLHELGHALTARRFGIRTRDITLLPIGGVARLERMPEDPKQELLVALAGPAVNVALAAMLFFVIVLVMGIDALHHIQLIGGEFLINLLMVNVGVAVFNLLPAFPMDGGRVLRALLAMRMDYARATQIAANIGQGMAVLFGLIGIYFNPVLLLIALFVWGGAAQEANVAQTKSALDGVPINRAMITEFRTLSPYDSLLRAADYLLTGFQQDFPVVAEERVVGVLAQSDILTALSQYGPNVAVSQVMRQQFQTADPFETLEEVFARLQTCGCHAIPVTWDGRLIGMVTLDNVGEFLMVQSALRQKPTGLRWGLMSHR
jgi:Zn-dependent protease/CBS domain-containing protein